MTYLDGLNPAQREAAECLEGPLLIVAGAGAGKTKTITHRIAHMIEKGISARSILAVTFTNKAASEMRERIEALLGKAKTGHLAAGSPGLSQSERFRGLPYVSTFHSLGVRLLREFHDEAGLARNFSIWDRDDSIRAVKAALAKLDIQQWKPSAILSAISRKKGDGMSAAEYTESARTFRERAVAEAWVLYEKALREEDALDFDDLLSRTLHLLKRSERVRSLLQSRWVYITIDEYQDTNKAQYEIAALLAGEKKNICVVGDTDQNIYSWRGADLGHLLEFENAFPGAKVVTLEQNYRSTRTILSAANGVIEKNLRRKPKNLFTEKETGEPITLYGGVNEMDEAWFIAQSAAALLETGTLAKEISVLYRENFQSRGIEEAMLNFGVPYRVLGTRFFERKEVKDALSYLRAALNPKNRIDLARIVSVPPRGIGKVTLDKMIAGFDDELPAAARTKVRAFRECLLKIRKGIDTLPASEAVIYAVEVSGMEAMYKKASDDTSTTLGAGGKERLDNIRELVNFAVRFDDNASPAGIERLLEEAALQSDQDQLEDANNAVSLMTIHASKGLEFDAVFITGLEQGLFPSTRESDGRDEEEERRLFYVALTRAKKRLFLTYAGQRMKYGSREFTIPSEFLDDIDARLIDVKQRKRSLLDDEDIIR